MDDFEIDKSIIGNFKSYVSHEQEVVVAEWLGGGGGGSD